VFTCHLAGPLNTPLSGGQVSVVVKTRKWWYRLHQYQDEFGPPFGYDQYYEIVFMTYLQTRYLWHLEEEISYTRYDFTIQKLLCEDASVTSRRVFGQPNLDGSLPGDANAELRNMNYSNWEFKGGLFVGHMPFETRDQSGTARIQLYPQGGQISQQSVLAILTLMPLGIAAGVPGEFEVTSYLPQPTDPDLDEPIETLTWATKWSQHWFSDKKALPALDGTNWQYANWFLGRSGNQTLLPMAVSKVGLRITSEQAAIDQKVSLWRYFAGKEYAAAFPQEFPLNDSQPRVWLVNEAITRW
jgi:hypothetical protein